MAQWRQLKLQLQYLSHQHMNELYPPTFPMDVRCYLASWIEEQCWDEIIDSPDQDVRALGMLDQIISRLQRISQDSTNVVEKMRLQQIANYMNVHRSQPLQLVKTVQETLQKERILLNQVLPTFPSPSPHASYSPAPSPLPGTSQAPGRADGPWGSQRDAGNRDVDLLVLKVLEIRECRQNIHQMQEDLNWERANFESLQVSFSSNMSNGLDPKTTEVQKLQSRIQQLEFNGQEISKKRMQLLREVVDCLEHCQARLLQRIKSWRREQHLASIGAPFDDNLGPLQTWCEQLLGVNVTLRQEIFLVGGDCPGSEVITELQERLGLLLQTLIQSSLMVDKQPPQVIKTQSKFSTTVRYLLGEKVTPGKPVVLKAQIITEMQARNLGQLGSIPTENVGELINNTAILEHNASTKSTCATFRNMSIKKIKRADRKGSESVTEEKFALLFSSEISITGCDMPCCMQVITLPIVVIVHGSQDNNALATIIWDCAFSEPDRVPFVVPERVPWKQMCLTLDSKFRLEVQTQLSLDPPNQHFLAQKIFDKPDICGDYSNMMVSWAQFNKEVLPGRSFTFWQWFDGVMELTKKHLKSYWSDKLIFGFIGKQQLHLILQDRPDGTFLLRFSDSEIGGITIAYVSTSENRCRRIQNIQPFTKRDLEIRCLGDRIRDIDFITHVYPDRPKNDVFRKYYTDDPQPYNSGYIPVSIQTKVAAGETSSPTSSTSSMTEIPQDPNRLTYSAAPLYPTMNPQGNGVFSSSQQFPTHYPSNMEVPLTYTDTLSLSPLHDMAQVNPPISDDMELDMFGTGGFEMTQ
ncbi:signal transducer and activator of transcription 6 [Conger conger]|nr:signal transducer and activator of transcription 6 [Conger conger]XP_061112729.1 signal transducer and activator of transcription 6 [Conger conger]XP_061112730.1 signal transducer and activator of transcription 6 [Conger conger]